MYIIASYTEYIYDLMQKVLDTGFGPQQKSKYLDRIAFCGNRFSAYCPHPYNYRYDKEKRRWLCVCPVEYFPKRKYVYQHQDILYVNVMRWLRNMEREWKKLSKVSLTTIKKAMRFDDMMELNLVNVPHFHNKPCGCDLQLCESLMNCIIQDCVPYHLMPYLKFKSKKYRNVFVFLRYLKAPIDTVGMLHWFASHEHLILHSYEIFVAKLSSLISESFDVDGNLFDIYSSSMSHVRELW